MQVQRINNNSNNLTFGKVFLNCKSPIRGPVPASRLLEELPADLLIRDISKIRAGERYYHPNYLLEIKKGLDESVDVVAPELEFLKDTVPELIIFDFLCNDEEHESLSKFAELVRQQEDNPHNIYLDVFPEDKGEIPIESYRWYQKAIIGDKVFTQRIYRGGGTAIKFLEDACKYANKLWRKNVNPEVTAFETAKSAEKDVPHRTTFGEILYAVGQIISGDA